MLVLAAVPAGARPPPLGLLGVGAAELLLNWLRSPEPPLVRPGWGGLASSLIAENLLEVGPGGGVSLASATAPEGSLWPVDCQHAKLLCVCQSSSVRRSLGSVCLMSSVWVGGLPQLGLKTSAPVPHLA